MIASMWFLAMVQLMLFIFQYDINDIHKYLGNIAHVEESPVIRTLDFDLNELNQQEEKLTDKSEYDQG